MNIKNVTPEDLSVLSVLTKDESLKHRQDICFEHSKMCVDENGIIVAAIVIRKNAVSNFFNGEIPIIDNDNANIKHACDIIPKSKQYEVVCQYLKEGETYQPLYEAYCKLYYDEMLPLGIVWMDFQKSPNNRIIDHVSYISNIEDIKSIGAQIAKFIYDMDNNNIRFK